MPWVLPKSTLSQEPGLRNAFVVDDDAKVRAFIAKVLVGQGFAAHELSRVPELEAALTMVRPDGSFVSLTLISIALAT